MSLDRDVLRHRGNRSASSSLGRHRVACAAEASRRCRSRSRPSTKKTVVNVAVSPTWTPLPHGCRQESHLGHERYVRDLYRAHRRRYRVLSSFCEALPSTRRCGRQLPPDSSPRRARGWLGTRAAETVRTLVTRTHVHELRCGSPLTTTWSCRHAIADISRSASVTCGLQAVAYTEH